MLAKTIKDIAALKIQGAENIARASLKAINHVAINSKASSKNAFINELVRASKALFNSRPTEPMMRNALRYVIQKAQDADNFNYKRVTLDRIKSLYGSVDKARQLIISIGKRVLKKNYKVLTHCHSSTVTGVLKAVKPEVICTETRPLFQGRLTASELVNAGVKTTMILDSAVADYIRDVDLVLLGCDVITPNSIINKVGSNAIGLLCEKYDIPLYICSTSFKLDPESTLGRGVKIEERSAKEVWNNPPRGLRILNPAFDLVPYDNITSFINELGVFSPDSLFINLRDKYHWMFKDIKSIIYK